MTHIARFLLLAVAAAACATEKPSPDTPRTAAKTAEPPAPGAARVASTDEPNLVKNGDLDFRLKKQNGLCLGRPNGVTITNVGKSDALLSGSDVSPYFKVDTPLNGVRLKFNEDLVVKVRPCNHEAGEFNEVLTIGARPQDKVGAVEVKLHSIVDP